MPVNMDLPLSFEDFRWYCLQYLPATKENEIAIKRGYDLEGYRTMNDGLRFVQLTVVFYHVLKTNPNFKKLSKKAQIKVMQDTANEYDPEWVNEIPGMRETLHKNFPDLW